jgi:hypothetical protein
MGNFEIGDYLVGTIIFTMLVLGVITIMGNVFDPSGTGEKLNNTDYGNFSKVFNKQAQLEGNISKLKSNVSESTPGDDSGLLSSINSLIKTAFSGVKFMLSSFNIMDDAYNGLSSIFKLPNWVSSLISVLITSLIIFAIYKLIFRSPTV